LLGGTWRYTMTSGRGSFLNGLFVFALTLFGLRLALGRRSSTLPTKKISVITPTARLDEHTNFPRFKKIAHQLRMGMNPSLPNDDDPLFKELLTKYVQDDQQTFLEATAESLKAQTFPPEDFEWIIVDVWAEKRRKMLKADRYSFTIKHVKEKPSLWHGLTEPPGWESEVKPPFPTPCNARNTGILLAEGELLVYADDTVLLMPRFLEVAWSWYRRGYALKGYRHKFTEDMRIDREFGDLWKDPGRVKSHSLLHIWGHILAVPLEWELEVNGWEEFLDGCIGAEDIEHGARLRRTFGDRCVLDQRALVYELGGFHIQTGRPHVRSNGLLLEFLYGSDCRRGPKRANLWRPSREQVERFVEFQKRAYREGRVGEMMAGKGEELHPYVFKTCEVPTFDLREMKKTWGGRS